jgi:hypothetical protein
LDTRALLGTHQHARQSYGSHSNGDATANAIQFAKTQVAILNLIGVGKNSKSNCGRNVLVSGHLPKGAPDYWHVEKEKEKEGPFENPFSI